MGSAKRGYPLVSRVLAAARRRRRCPGRDLIARCRDELTASVHAVNRLTPTIVEVVLRAPAAARAFRPGQFYRLQNYEMNAPRLAEAGLGTTLLAMEGLAMTGAWTDKARGPAVGHRAGDGRQFRSVRASAAGRAGGADGADRHAHRHPRQHHRGAGRRRAGQCGAVLDRRGDAGGRIEGDLLRRLQGDARPLQGGGDRARRRRDRLVLRRGARLHADPAAGPQLRRQHRAGDGGLWRRAAGRASRFR